METIELSTNDLPEASRAKLIDEIDIDELGVHMLRVLRARAVWLTHGGRRRCFKDRDSAAERSPSVPVLGFV